MMGKLPAAAWIDSAYCGSSQYLAVSFFATRASRVPRAVYHGWPCSLAYDSGLQYVRGKLCATLFTVPKKPQHNVLGEWIILSVVDHLQSEVVVGIYLRRE